MNNDTEEMLRNAANLRNGNGNISESDVSRFYSQIESEVSLGSDLTQSLQPYANKAIGAETKSSVVLRKVEGEGAKGFSGAPVFIITENEIPKGVLKFFTQPKQFIFELSSLEYIYSQKFEKFKVPDILSVSKASLGEEPIGVGLYSFASDDKAAGGLSIYDIAPGTPLDDMIRAVGELPRGSKSREEAVERLCQGVESTAEALGELHTKSFQNRPPAQSYVNHTARTAASRLQDLMRKDVYRNLGIDSRYEAWLDTKIEAFRANPGTAAVIHNDAHQGNYFYSSETQTTAIDTSAMHFSLNAQGEGIVSPARDFANFEQKLAKSR